MLLMIVVNFVPGNFATKESVGNFATNQRK